MYNVDYNYKSIENSKNSKYYGQWNTDSVIESYFKGKVTGTCIDVGAADGKRGSNTKYFENLGWNVLCIEPNINFKDALRDRKLVRYFALGDFDGVSDFYVYNVGEYEIETSISSLNPDKRLVKDHKHLVNNVYATQVDVRTLNTVLSKEVKGTVFHETPHVDFISIDTEGTELDVLKGIDFDKFSATLFVIENNYSDSEIEVFMNSKNYKKVTRYYINEFYMKEDIT